jgi:hypothetical protein
MCLYCPPISAGFLFYPPFSFLQQRRVGAIIDRPYILNNSGFDKSLTLRTDLTKSI